MALVLAGVLALAAGAGDPPAPKAGGIVQLDVNTATAEELCRLPGIGPKKAAAIVKRRPYRRLSQLLEVRGIGKRTLARLKPYLKVERSPVVPRGT